MLAFVHIPRTGGSKFNVDVSRFFPGRTIINTGDRPVAADIDAALRSPDRNWFIGGHVSFSDLRGVLDTREPDDLLFSTTRHPIDRAVSLYALARRSPDWLPNLAEVARSGCFKDFYAAAVAMGALAHNAQCVMLCGNADTREALAALTAHYDAVGTYRYYAAFLDAAGSRIAKHVPGFRFDRSRVNVAWQASANPAESLDHIVDADTRARIEADNDQDMALVECLETLPGGCMARPVAV